MKLHPILASRFYADGGTMFGLVPRTIWQQFLVPDEFNRIPQNMNTWLIETDDGEFGLLDVGCGNPSWMSDKQRQIAGVDPCWHLQGALRTHGIDMTDIGFIALTHLHWDHAGAIGRVLDDGGVEHTFPNADVFICDDEWQLATSGDPLLFRAYPSATIAPIEALPENRRHCLAATESIIRPGIRFAHTGGHTGGHCAIVFDEGSYEICHPEIAILGSTRRAVYAGDVCPSQHHLRLVYHTAYDTYPMQTRQWKRTHLPLMAEQQDVLLFDHDVESIAATLQAHPQLEITPSTRLATMPEACAPGNAVC
jgi:glyoxylase-like metal-dependent hydrolase (beta-lactamase superfamily II)